MAYPNDLLLSIDRAHYQPLARLLRMYKNDYACGLITLHFLSAMKSESATNAEDLQTVDDKKLSENGYHTLILDDYHRRCSAEILKDGNCMRCTADHIRINYYLWLYDKIILVDRPIS